VRAEKPTEKQFNLRPAGNQEKKQKNKEKLKTKIVIAQSEDTVMMLLRVVSPGEG